MVPAPESKSRRLLPTLTRAEQVLLSKDGTQVPDPNILIFMVFAPGQCCGSRLRTDASWKNAFFPFLPLIAI
jgi:hypothetical protein